MIGQKIKILEAIFEQYQHWIKNETFHCHRGCSLCCTQNVMITEVEGQYIYNFILQENRDKWFAEKLLQEKQINHVHQTTNGFARICIEKNTDYVDAEQPNSAGKCPFLDENCCTIYAVRPFSCRSFASSQNCQNDGTAHLSEKLLVINTVSMQLVEHLGQKGYWGNMLDVLMALSQHKINAAVKNHINDNMAVKRATMSTLTAEPIPGFLLKPEEEKEVNQYLKFVLTTKVGMKTIEEIFNNK